MKIPRGVCEELLEMERRDLEETERLAKSGELEKYGYHPALQKLHERNCGRLGEIWERYGMPTLQNGGEEAVLAAWRIAQHAIGSPAFMRRFAAECDKYSSEEIPLRGRAYLADRIAFYERRRRGRDCRLWPRRKSGSRGIRASPKRRRRESARSRRRGSWRRAGARERTSRAITACAEKFSANGRRTAARVGGCSSFKICRF